MSRTIPHVSDNDRPVIENQLSTDFDCVYKISEGPGMWTVIGTNLNLGVNDEFRDFIIAAAERTGVDPACLAALIDIEAANTDLRKFLDRSVSFISGHGSIAGTTRAPL